MKCCKLNPFIKVLNINPKISRSFFGMYNNNGIVWKPIGNRQIEMKKKLVTYRVAGLNDDH